MPKQPLKAMLRRLGKLILITSSWILIGRASIGVAQILGSDSTQYRPTLTYDVASLRESRDVGEFFVGGDDPSHVASIRLVNVSLLNLITMAYGIKIFQVEGGPSWISSRRFNLQAKAEAAASDKLAGLSDEQARLEKQHMLQMLLADRFRLRVHSGTKNGPIFVLEVSKHGPQFSRSKPEAEGGRDTTSDHSHDPRPIYQQGDNIRGYEFIAHKCSMQTLANSLSGQVGSPVEDGTKLAGFFDFALKYHDIVEDASAEVASSASGVTRNWPPLFTAIQEQLGLKLRPARGPELVVVVDSAELPAAN